MTKPSNQNAADQAGQHLVVTARKAIYSRFLQTASINSKEALSVHKNDYEGMFVSDLGLHVKEKAGTTVIIPWSNCRFVEVE